MLKILLKGLNSTKQRQTTLQAHVIMALLSCSRVRGLGGCVVSAEPEVVQRMCASHEEEREECAVSGLEKSK